MTWFDPWWLEQTHIRGYGEILVRDADAGRLRALWSWPAARLVRTSRDVKPEEAQAQTDEAS
jgi:hypothetical protein